MSWALVGQVGTAIAAILGAISLWRLIFEKRHKVVLAVDTVGNPAPDPVPYFRGALSKALPHAVSVSDHGYARVFLSSPRDDQSFEAVRNDFISSLLHRLSDDVAYELGRYKFGTLIRAVLENKGKKTAKSIVLDLNFEPTLFETSSPEALLEGRSVRMIELRPGQRVVLSFWMGYELNPRIRAAHEDHEISETLTHSVTGWRALVAKHVLQPYMLFAMLTLVGYILAVTRMVGVK